MQRILILGAGFAGLWAAVGAALARDVAGISADQIEILVLDHSSCHSIRVRNYEAELSDTVIPLKVVLDPVGVRHKQGEVMAIDVVAKSVGYVSDGSSRSVSYDRLVCALGSELVWPAIPGLAEHGFNVDTFGAAEKLGEHLAALPARQVSNGQYTVLVVGAGLTGIEAAAEMPARLRAVIEKHAAFNPKPVPRVILADRGASIAAAMGGAQPVITEALRALGVETLVGVSLSAVDKHGVMLTTGERLPTATVVWCAGMTAHPLAAQFPVERDKLGRLPVDEFLRINGIPATFAAGDIARLMVDEGHESIMSCQHSRPMGRFAGHNVFCDLLGKSMISLKIPWYTTILDLGEWGAVYTEGWDRQLVATGAEAKRTKEIINRQRIYPPLSGDRQAIFDAAEPIVQAPPQRFT